MCQEPATASDVHAAMPHPAAGRAADPIALKPVDDVAVATLVDVAKECRPASACCHDQHGALSHAMRPGQNGTPCGGMAMAQDLHSGLQFTAVRPSSPGYACHPTCGMNAP